MSSFLSVYIYEFESSIPLVVSSFPREVKDFEVFLVLLVEVKGQHLQLFFLYCLISQ